MDELERELAALGGARPLPASLRARLEQALVAQAPAAEAVATDDNLLVGIDSPRPLPPALDGRLTATLATEAAPLPRRLRRRVEAALMPSAGGRRPVAVALAVAAAVVLLVATVGTLVRPGGGGRSSRQSVAAKQNGAAQQAGGQGGSSAAEASGAVPTPGAGGAAGAPAADAAAGAKNATAAVPSAGARASVGGAGAAAASPFPPGGRTAPPPFAFDPNAAGSPVPGAGAPVRVGVIGGDQAEEAGFRAYVQRLNQAGGAGGHTFALVPVSSSRPGQTAVTVNLSGAPVAGAGGPPGWASGPLLETLAAPEAVTRGNVFDLASPPERQAHLLADAVFPGPAPGATAVVYQAPSGPLGDQVPAAFDAVLRARGVTAVHVVYHAGDGLSPVQGDAVLLSLDTAASRDWLNRARAAGLSPPRGMAGLYSLLDAGLLPALPSGTRVESPYLLPSGAEAAAMRQDTGLAPSDAVTHGWVTAKALAVAVWQSGAVDAVGLHGALSGLRGYADGFAPPYQTRAGSNARQPEGVLFTVQNGAFTGTGAFRTDPF
ncbi:MAG TPA: hypothetical protein VKI20_04035 [Acidimicrobiales bacterium]|nr:hypothetical protein [Acidimicrobiales bacterium]